MSKLIKNLLRRSLVFVLGVAVSISFISCEKEKEDERPFDIIYPYSREVPSGIDGAPNHDCIRTKNYYVYATMIPRTKDESSIWVEIPYSDEHYMKTYTGVPTNYIITYEDVSIIGTFAGYAQMASSGQLILGDHYITYTLQDTLFSKVELHIIQTGQEKLGEEEHMLYGLSRLDPSCVTPNSKMRTLLSGYTGGFVDVEGVRYIYTHGKLQGIKWVHAGFEFILCEFENYPADRTETFIGKLLDPTLVGDAVSFFNQQLDARREVLQ